MYCVVLLDVQVEYAHQSQISFLRLIYTAASQKITYFCSNSVAYKDSRTGSTESAIALLGNNDFEFANKSLRKKYVLLDGCAVSMKIKLDLIASVVVRLSSPFHSLSQ